MQQNDIAAPGDPSRTVRLADWTVRVLLGLAFIAAGAAKLAGAPPMVQLFDAIGIGQWFRFVTGVLELLGGTLILIPRTCVAGAGLLAVIMVCAVATHIMKIGGNPGPAVALLLLGIATLYLRLRFFRR